MSYCGMDIVDVLPSWEVVVLECGGSACDTYIIHLIFGIGPTEDIKARIKGRGRDRDRGLWSNSTNQVSQLSQS